MFGIGAGEFVIILVAGLILFGPSKLPELGKSLGKALREFRKAQAALSATLEGSAEPVKKSSPPAQEKVSEEKNSDKKISAVTVDDVINLAKKNPISEENLNEKISDGGSVNNVSADSGTGNDNTRGSTDGSGKKSESAKN